MLRRFRRKRQLSRFYLEPRKPAPPGIGWRIALTVLGAVAGGAVGLVVSNGEPLGMLGAAPPIIVSIWQAVRDHRRERDLQNQVDKLQHRIDNPSIQDVERQMAMATRIANARGSNRWQP